MVPALITCPPCRNLVLPVPTVIAPLFSTVAVIEPAVQLNVPLIKTGLLPSNHAAAHVKKRERKSAAVVEVECATGEVDLAWC